MATLTEQEKRDNRQRAKVRAIQRKQTLATITRQMTDMIRQIRGIPQEEWDAAVREDQASAE